MARLRAMRIAFEKGKELPPFMLAFSQPTFQKVQANLHIFEGAVQESHRAYNIQVGKSKEYARLLKKARLYLSHFVQVVNMAIARGDLSSSDRDYFGFGRDQSRVPLFNSEKEIIAWGEKLIQGETVRIKKGLTPISNPSIALVKVRYEDFFEAYRHQKILQKNLQRSQEKITELRKVADDIIATLWNEVEAHYGNLPDETRRVNARLYGVVYFYRKSELTSS